MLLSIFAIDVFLSLQKLSGETGRPFAKEGPAQVSPTFDAGIMSHAQSMPKGAGILSSVFDRGESAHSRSERQNPKVPKRFRVERRKFSQA
jgi:hypothetical protein